MYICDNIGNCEGHLTFAGIDTTLLAEKYGTPLYLMDEDKIRENCRIYKNAFTKYFGENALPLFASKSASFKRLYEIMAEEKMGIDVVSSGEVYTAIKAGFDLKNAYFHSNNKTDFDIEFAIQNGIGYFVVDNIQELERINFEAGKQGKKQDILLRLTPGIDPHTFEAISTGKVDSKFGSAIETGQAEIITCQALEMENINLCGFHCHIGSQIFETEPFYKAAEVMLEFISLIKEKYCYEISQLNLGGGYGVRYTNNDPVFDIDGSIKQVAKSIKEICEIKKLSIPKILMEPGRSIVANAGMTLYTAGTVKEIPGFKSYVSIDGGMTDNPRYALYKADYTVLNASKADKTPDFKCSVVGRCCESGDIIQENVNLVKPTRGEIIAVCTTGAYNYSMASNYNRVGKPPVIMLSKGKDYIAVKGETLEDIVRNDI
ncbi:MAG: diaminopimelate decarboxylase [Clostridia bacterium]|nr:diaminopimelate decarboxylase [Clostridia bacterium]